MAAKHPTNWMDRAKRILWEQNPAELTLLRRTLLRQMQALVLVFQDFSVNQSLLRAAALTYYTMLSLVPLLALTFALLKAFGVQNLLQPLVLSKLNVGDGRIAEAILGYINNTQVAQLGAFGLLFLLVAVISLLTNVEKTFNYIWGVRELRPMLRRFADYLSVILVGPVLIISAISMTSTLTSNRLVKALLDIQLVGSLVVVLFKVIPFLFMWLAFTVLYMFMTNIKVEWRAAFFGGVVGGSLWQLAQVGYVHFQVGVGRYNAIYGTMAALPIFMVWLYVSWVIVLFGLGVCYAKQNLRTSNRDLRSSEVNRESFEQVALAVMVTLAERFSSGVGPMSHEKLSQCLAVPSRLCRSVLETLTRLGLVVEVSSRSERNQYQLGRSAEKLELADFFRRIRSCGEDVRYLLLEPQVRIAMQIYQEIESVTAEGLQGMSLQDLADRCRVQDTLDTPLLAAEK